MTAFIVLIKVYGRGYTYSARIEAPTQKAAEARASALAPVYGRVINSRAA